jgi:hypothetical protein
MIEFVTGGCAPQQNLDVLKMKAASAYEMSTQTHYTAQCTDPKTNNYFGLYVVNHAINRLHRDLHFQFLAQLDVFKGLYIVSFEVNVKYLL